MKESAYDHVDSLKGTKVLYIGDDRAISTTTRILFSIFGCEAQAFENPQTVLDALNESPRRRRDFREDILVVGSMDQDKGHELLKAVRRRRPRMAVLVLTGIGSSPYPLNAKNHDGKHERPSTPGDLARSMRQVLDSTQLRRPSRSRQSRVV